MIAVFLAAEAGSARYGPRIRELLTGLGQPYGIAEHPDTSDQAANAVRRRVLAAYRGYPAGDVFTGMPADVAWHHAALTPAELATIRYLDYGYWTDFSGGTRLASDGARRLGPAHRQLPGSGYRRIAEDLRDGRLPPMIIVLGEPVRAEKPVQGSDQQSCHPSRQAVMITGHVPAVRLPPDHAGSGMAAAVTA